MAVDTSRVSMARRVHLLCMKLIAVCKRKTYVPGRAQAGPAASERSSHGKRSPSSRAHPARAPLPIEVLAAVLCGGPTLCRWRFLLVAPTQPACSARGRKRDRRSRGPSFPSLGSDNGLVAPCCVQEAAAQVDKLLRVWRRRKLPDLRKSAQVARTAFIGESMMTRLVAR